MKKAVWLVFFAIALPLFAVTPQFWEVRTYDDFRRGKLSNLSLTSDNELVLAPKVDTVFVTDQPLVWSAVSDAAGNVYLGTGHDGKVFKVDPAGKGALMADLAELDVTALALDARGVLYAATSPDGKVYRVEVGKAPQVFYEPHTKYIWSMVFDRQGRLLVGTGDKGVIFRVAADGKGEAFYSTDETHIMSMAMDRDGNLIAGGDPKGYIYRITPEGKAFVLYDSGMREVHSIAIGRNGNIYAAVLSGRPGFMAPSATPAPAPTTPASADVSITVTANSVVTSTGQESVQVVDGDSAGSPRASARRAGSDSGSQSVILEIQPDGTVNTLWHSHDEMVFSLLPRGDKLLFSTGSKGRVYSLENSRDTTLLLESSEEQTTRLLDAGPRVYMTTANVGKLFGISGDLNPSGTYESTIRDTDAVSAWGKLALKARNAELVQVMTRSGNTGSPDKTWSEWAALDSQGRPASPKARFFQWKAELRSDRDKAPVLTSLTVPYLQQNFRPEVGAIELMPAGISLVKTPTFNASGIPTGGNDPAAARASARAGQPAAARVPPRRVNQKGAQSFQWTASDKNEDYLTFDVYYRGDGEKNWKLLKKDLEDTFFTINSDTLPDGVYQVRVAASDLASNPPELAMTGELASRPFSIDNTPPVISMKLEAIDKGRARIAIDAADATSTLNQAEVSVDTGEWRPLLSKDGIVDSKAESFSYLAPPMAAGEHVIAFRVYDQNDNVGMQSLVVRIP